MTTVITGAGVTTTGSVIAAAVNQTSPPLKKLVQHIIVENGAYSSPANVPIPLDTTIPQSNEGVLILTASITPKDINSTLVIEADVNIAANAGGAWGIAALFKDAIADAISVNAQYIATNGEYRTIRVKKRISVGSLSPITLSVRAGLASAGSIIYINGTSIQYFAGVLFSTLDVKEYLP